MRHTFIQGGKNFFRGFAGQLQIKRIRAEVELARPLKRTKLGNSNLFKNLRAIPSLENAAARDVAKVDNTGDAIIKTKEQLVTLERFSLGNFHN